VRAAREVRVGVLDLAEAERAIGKMRLASSARTRPLNIATEPTYTLAMSRYPADDGSYFGLNLIK
jgi:hypothetical protein